jgi:hypothetical protein
MATTSDARGPGGGRGRRRDKGPQGPTVRKVGRDRGVKVNHLAARGIRAGHPWVFRDSVLRPIDGLEPGAPIRVLDEDGNGLCWALHEPEGAIALRVIAAGLSLGLGVSLQLGDQVFCGGECLMGFVERVAFGHAFAFAAAAGSRRGKADAFDDAVLKRYRDGRRAKLAGSVLLGLGLGIGIINEGLWWSFIATGGGPFADHDYARSLAISRAMLDIATITGSTGVGLLTWEARYRRDRAGYRNARVLSLAPAFGPALTGATFQGRF